MDIILFGIQGSGKGSLGKSIIEKYGYERYETGAEFRKIAQENTELGREIKATIDQGKLVPDNIVMEIVNEQLNALPKTTKILFDGFPRTMMQAQELQKLLLKHNRRFIGILIDVPEDVVIHRLSTRKVCEKCNMIFTADYKGEYCDHCGTHIATRTDDNPESVKQRLKHFYELTVPAIKYYQDRGEIVVMDGNRPLPEATEMILKIVEKALHENLERR